MNDMQLPKGLALSGTEHEGLENNQTKRNKSANKKPKKLIPTFGSSVNEIYDFLPGALSIQERPPNPAARWLARSLLLLLILAVAWAYFGQVNVVATAEGKIIPSDRVKQIQPLTKSMVSKILVREGQSVTQGQALVELDATLTNAESVRLQGELSSTEAHLQINKNLLLRLSAFMSASDLNDVTTSSADQALSKLPGNIDADTDWASTYTLLFEEKWRAFLSQNAILKREYGAARSETEVSKELIKKLELTLPIATKRAANFETLHGQQFVSENDYWLVEQERIQQFQDLAAERKRYDQLSSNLQALESRKQNYLAEFKSQLLTEIAEQKRSVAVLKQEYLKADSLNNKQILYSPVDGQVQELAINTVGGVVTDAQQLMLIVPEEQTLEAEVFLANKDIGFVTEDMNAEIKVHTFPFTKYGVVKAVVTNVSDDATLDEQLGLIYRLQLRLESSELHSRDKALKLMPGMSVTAEVKTGHRRIIEFFLGPLLQHKNESLRER